MQGALLLDVVVCQRFVIILQQLALIGELLLVGGNTLLFLYFGFYSGNVVAGLHLQGDMLSGESLDENLHGAGVHAQHGQAQNGGCQGAEQAFFLH